MAIDIEIKYKLRSNNDYSILKLTPEQYFDPLDPGEEYTVDEVPRLIFDIRDYLKEVDENMKDEDITNVNVFIKDIEKNEEINHYYTYWNDGKNMLIEVKNKKLSGLNHETRSYHEIIVNLRIEQDTCEILRLLDENGTLRPTMHCRIYDNPDGSQSEFNYFSKRWVGLVRQ